MGRERINPNTLQDARLAVRLDTATYQRLQMRARQMGTTPGGYIRDILLRDLDGIA